MIRRTPATRVDVRRLFYAEAGAAIRAGLLTPAEMIAIVRPGTRKSGYWGRHLMDLRAVLAERPAYGASDAKPCKAVGNKATNGNAPRNIFGLEIENAKDD